MLGRRKGITGNYKVTQDVKKYLNTNTVVDTWIKLRVEAINEDSINKINCRVQKLKRCGHTSVELPPVLTNG